MDDNLKAKKRFTNVAEDYAKARPGYPDEAIDFILQHCNLKAGNLLVDIGSGTGISSRAFSQHGLKVVGIEPNEEMRKRALQSNEVASTDDSPTYRDGSAEATGLKDNCANAVLAAQAFHWFDSDKALKEFARILKPRGWVILLCNEGDHSDSTTKKYFDLIRQFSSQDLKQIMQLREKGGAALLAHSLFSQGRKLVFPNQQILDEQSFYSRALSASYLSKDEGFKEKLISSLSKLFQDEQNAGQITLKYGLETYLACLIIT